MPQELGIVVLRLKHSPKIKSGFVIHMSTLCLLRLEKKENCSPFAYML